MTAERRPAFSHYTEDGRSKVRYPNRREAKAAARRFLAQDGKQRLWPYQCADAGCGAWHLSHTPPRRGEP